MNMPEQEQTEELKAKHRRTKRTLKIVGVIIAVAGLGLVIMGFTDMILASSEGESPSLFWGLIAGLPMLAIGGALCLMGFRKEMARYIKNESVPVLNEAGQELTPAVNAVVSTAKNAEGNLCPHCGGANEEAAKFCRHCGSAFFVTCPHCGETVKEGKFCDKCGSPLH